eukprot:NODE_52_length_30984_cov_1.383358.p10 type:complete len:391 gc:universal NODE_52_length_30984_cov_1.383358:14749-15921(+)
MILRSLAMVQIYYLTNSEINYNDLAVPIESLKVLDNHILLAEANEVHLDGENGRVNHYMDKAKHLINSYKNYKHALCIYLFCCQNTERKKWKLACMCNISYLYTELQDFTEAKRVAKKAYDMEKSHYKALIRLCSIAERQGDLTEMIKICELGLQNPDENAQLYFSKKLKESQNAVQRDEKQKLRMGKLFNDVLFDHPSIDTIEGFTLLFYKDLRANENIIFEESTRTFEVAKSYKKSAFENCIRMSSTFRKVQSAHREDEIQVYMVYGMLLEDFYRREMIVSVTDDKFALPIPRNFRIEPSCPNMDIQVSEMLLKNIFKYFFNLFQFQYRNEQTVTNVLRNYRTPLMATLYQDYDDVEVIQKALYELVTYNMLDMYKYKEVVYFKARDS